MLPTYHQWSHCWICTLQQVEHQYRLPGIPCKYHPKCSHGVFLLQSLSQQLCVSLVKMAETHQVVTYSCHANLELTESFWWHLQQLACHVRQEVLQSKRCYHFLFTPGRRQKGEEAPNFSLTVLVSSQYVYDFSFGTNYCFKMLYYNRVETDCNNTMVIISTRTFSNVVFMFV